MSEYHHPYRDANFVLRELVDFDGLCETLGLEDINMELAEVVIEEAGKFATEAIAPTNRVGDEQGPKLTEEGVQESPGFADVYQQFIESGWQSLTVDEAYGGQNLPGVLGTAVNEIWQSANTSWALCQMLTQGAIEAIAHHANDELKETYLPRMAMGEWTGTMNLTEPDAGSDLAAIKARAVPDGDAYRISGQKIFISWGDHQMTPNIVHLVLARLPDAPPGVKGISLFVVPKFLLDADGEPAEANGVGVLSLEHKLGLHGSPTCVMEFENSLGYLVGEAHKGLMYMFTMMNHARQAVGVQALGVTERAYQQALMYSRDRLQGTRKDGSRIPIIDFPDVRRMLLTMKSTNEAMRAIALVSAAQLDRARATGDAEEMARAELYTPIVKGWLTEMGNEITSVGVQIHGGMGFIEETGAAQHMRDVRVFAIYEGTNGIQALDFIGRKTLMNQGKALQALLADMQSALDSAQANDGLPPRAVAAFANALIAAKSSYDAVLTGAEENKAFAPSVAFHFLMQFGYLMGAWLMLRSADRAAQYLAADEGDTAYFKGKLQTTAFFCEQMLPRAQAHAAALNAGSDTIVNFEDDWF